MINTILHKQQEFIPKYTHKWLQIGLLSVTTNSDEVKRIVNVIHKMLGLKQPEVILFDSPYHALKRMVDTNDFGNNIGEPLEKVFSKQIYSIRLQIKKQLAQELWFYLRKKLLNPLIDLFLDTLEPIFWNYLEEKLEMELGDKWKRLNSLLWIETKLHPLQEFEPSVELYYNSFSSWANISEACLCDFCISVLECDYSSEEWTIFENIVKYSGWIFPYENVCLVSKRPSVIRLDEQNKLHGDNVPAIQFADNFSVYANHGNILDFLAK
jgi:hypothetical protein